MYSSGPRQEPEQAGGAVSGKLPYEVVQSGFRAYWSSRGYQSCDRHPAEAHLTNAVKESIQDLPEMLNNSESQGDTETSQ